MAERIDVTTLGLPQLEQIRDNLGEDIEQIQEGLNSLKQATYGYIQSKEAAKSITSANEGKEILIPMTSSISFLILFSLLLTIILLNSFLNSFITCLYQVN